MEEVERQILRDEQDEIITKGASVALEAINIGRRAERQKIIEMIEDKIESVETNPIHEERAANQSKILQDIIKDIKLEASDE